MDPNKKQRENETPRDQQSKENENISEAHRQAEEDMKDDAELTAHSPNDDLDEGESARLGENPEGFSNNKSQNSNSK